MYNMKSKFHKGSSVLVSALVTAAASTLIGYGLTKMISTGIDAIKNQEVKMQGQQYAASRVNVLRSVRFDSLSPMLKRQINDTDYYEEVVEDGSTADRKNYAVNIFKGDSPNPVAIMNLSRTATGALLDNQGADSYDSLGAGGNADSSALNTSALKNYTNDKFSADADSFETDRAMDVKSFVSYVDGLLSKYRFRNNAVTVGANGAGSRKNPIYVTAAERECTAGSVTYAMSGNSQGYLATVTPAGNGLYYVDYIEKDVPDESTGSGAGGSTTGGGNSEIVAPDKFYYKTKWDDDKFQYDDQSGSNSDAVWTAFFSCYTDVIDDLAFAWLYTVHSDSYSKKSFCHDVITLNKKPNSGYVRFTNCDVVYEKVKIVTVDEYNEHRDRENQLTTSTAYVGDLSNITPKKIVGNDDIIIEEI